MKQCSGKECFSGEGYGEGYGGEDYGDPGETEWPDPVPMLDAAMSLPYGFVLLSHLSSVISHLKHLKKKTKTCKYNFYRPDNREK